MRTWIQMVMCLLCSSLAVSPARAADATAATVPLFLHYHGQLTDGGGTPLSGPVALQVRITDANHTALYAEDQTVTAFAGAVSAVVGNGTAVNTGAVQGGVPLDVFTPGESRLLEVWVDGALHGDPAEIVSVPYAMWSQTALRVAPGGVSTEQLAPDFFDDFAPQLVASPAYQSALADVQSAATIGVNSTFAYSASTTLQGVLEDFDNAIKAREVKNVDRAGDTMTGKLVITKGGLEVVGDVAVGGTIDGVDLSARDDALQSHIDAETAHGSDGAVVGANTLTSVASGLSSSIGTLTSTTNALSSSLSTLVADTNTVDLSLSTHIAANTAHGSNGNVVGETTLTNRLTSKLDVGGGTVTGMLNMSGNQIKMVGAPTADADAATKSYVDNALNPTNPGGSSGPAIPRIVAWGRFECGGDTGECSILAGGYGIASSKYEGNVSGGLPGTLSYSITLEKKIANGNYAVMATCNSVPAVNSGVVGTSNYADDSFRVSALGAQKFSVAVITTN